MEIGACSTSITDADRGTDQEVPVVHEFSSETTPFEIVKIGQPRCGIGAM